MKKSFIALLLLLAPVACLGSHFEAGALTDQKAESVQFRAGYEIAPDWILGGLVDLYRPDVDGTDFGAGIYVKHNVDPNIILPLQEFLPAIGEVLGLPKELQASPYLLADIRGLYAKDTSDDEHLYLSTEIGPGVQIGPITIEWVYAIAESGGSDDPITLSGPVLRFGAILEF